MHNENDMSQDKTRPVVRHESQPQWQPCTQTYGSKQ